jgi:formamidopyrimidine-DNA glycosylase
MPELPEVETVRRVLAPLLVGERVRSVTTSGKALRLARPIDSEGLEHALVGHTITEVSRRAKYLVIETDGEGVVIVHLGMTGRLIVCEPGAEERPHTHVVVGFESGRELRYSDVRRFGFVAPATRAELGDLPELAGLGIEPLAPALTGDLLYEMTRGVRTSIKAFLLDQSRVAGLGNIYACEALHVAKISPRVRARRLSRKQIEALRDGIVLVIRLALKNRGTTFSDFLDAEGREGENAKSLRVYLRDGQPCLNRCGAKIKRIVQSGRSTFFCPKCQSSTNT